jgi:glycosyltransferase involved in cell wall biosynthesis
VAGDFRPTGGMDRANYHLASYLAGSLGRPVSLVAHHVAAPLAEHPDVRVYSVARPFGSHALAEPLLDLTGRWVASRLRASDPRTRVVVNGGNCLSVGVNWVHYVHAAYPSKPVGTWARRMVGSLKDQRFRRHERRALRHAPLVIANSQRTRQHLVEYLGIAEARVRVVYLAAEPTQFRPPSADERAAARAALGWPPDVPYFLFVGSPRDHRKGLDIVLSAWRALAEGADWDAHLVVVGEGAEDCAWQQGLQRVHGLKVRPNIHQLYWGCDALVSPTRYEAYGLAVHEAVCCGLPALVSGSAGVAERFPGELSDLALPDPEDIGDLVARLRRCRADLGAARRRVAPLAASLRTRTWEHVARDVVELVETTTIHHKSFPSDTITERNMS